MLWSQTSLNSSFKCLKLSSIRSLLQKFFYNRFGITGKASVLHLPLHILQSSMSHPRKQKSLNSRIKEHGSLKKDLSKYNLDQLLLQHLMSITREKHCQTKPDIFKCIKDGQGWSKQVDIIWKEDNSSTNYYD